MEGILRDEQSQVTAAIVEVEIVEDEIITSRQLTHKPPPGTKLSVEMVERIRSHLANGASISRATQAAGVTPKTYRNWRDRSDKGEPAFAEAFGIFETAISQSIVEDIEFIRSGKQGWQARAWRLERQFPNEFALVNRVNSTVDAVHTLRIEWGKVAQEKAEDGEDSDHYLTATA